jgi:hypothetical protein
MPAYHYMIRTDTSNYRLTLRALADDAGYSAELLEDGNPSVQCSGAWVERYEFNKDRALQGVREKLLIDALQKIANVGRIISIAGPSTTG